MHFCSSTYRADQPSAQGAAQLLPDDIESAVVLNVTARFHEQAYCKARIQISHIDEAPGLWPCVHIDSPTDCAAFLTSGDRWPGITKNALIKNELSEATGIQTVLSAVYPRPYDIFSIAAGPR